MEEAAVEEEMEDELDDVELDDDELEEELKELEMESEEGEEEGKKQRPMCVLKKHFSATAAKGLARFS